MLARYQSITGVCLVNNQIIQMVDFERIVAAIDPTMMLEETSGEKRDEAVDFNKAVLIADDSVTIRTQMRRALEGAGFRVVAHHDGQVAWDYLEGLRAAGKVDEEILAVVTDIEMPRMDGHHLCLKIKEQPAYRNIPVILFSSMISPGLRNKGTAVGADDQITKPELSNLVDRLFACILAKHS
jgi:two-component system chemotaxis response regulator CheV